MSGVELDSFERDQVLLPQRSKVKTYEHDGFTESNMLLTSASNDALPDSPETNFGRSKYTNGEDPSDFPEDSRAYLVCLGSFFGLVACFGTTNSTGAIQSYTKLHQLAGLSMFKSSLIYGVFLCFTYSTGVITGVTFDAFGPRAPLFCATTLAFLGLFFTGSAKTVSQLTGTLALAGIGIGGLSAPLTGVISHWFLAKRGLAFGLATVGGSVGGIVFPVMLNHLYITVGFEWALRIYAFVCLGLMLISIALVQGRSKELPAKPKIDTTGMTTLQKFITHVNDKIDFAAFTHADFFFCALGIGLSDVALSCTMTYFTSYVTYIGYSETLANTMLTIVNCMGMLGRFLPGILADKIGCYNVQIIMITLTAVSILAIWLGWSTNTKSRASLYAFSIIWGFFNASVLSLSPSCIGTISPTRDFGRRYGAAYLFAGIFVLVVVIIGGVILGTESLMHYRYFALYIGILNLMSALSYSISRYIQAGFRLKVFV